MRLIAFLLAAQACFGACATSWANGYAKCIEVTLDHTKVPNTDLTDFTNMICANGAGGTNCDASLTTLTVATLKGTGSGGSATSASCFDCIWTSDNAGTTLLNWDTDTYVTASGFAVFWVKKTRSHTVDDKIYLFIGNAGTVTFQGGSTGSAWPSLAAGYHLGDGTSLVLTDNSTAGLTLTNTSSVAGVSQIAGGVITTAAHFVSQASNVTLPGDWTLSAWVNTTSLTEGVMVKVSTNTGAGQEYILLTATNGRGQVGDAGGGSGRAIGTSFNNDGVNHLVHGSFSAAGFKIYVDGVLETTQASGNLTSVDGIWLGRQSNGTSPCVCTIDEAHVWAALLSADWIATEYNNQKTPSTFYSFAAAVDPVTSGVKHRVIM